MGTFSPSLLTVMPAMVTAWPAITLALTLSAIALRGSDQQFVSQDPAGLQSQLSVAAQLQASSWDNAYDHTCLTITGTSPAAQGSCQACRWGCPLDSSCDREKKVAPDCDANNEPVGCIKKISAARREAVAQSMAQQKQAAEASGTSSSGRNKLFLGIEDWSAEPIVMDPNQTYWSGIIGGFVGMLIVAGLALNLAECLCCARAALGADMRSEDSFCTKCLKCFGAGTACCIESCHPSNDDNCCKSLIKLLCCGPFCCPCCCAPCNCLGCCAPQASVVMKKDEDGTVTVFSGGISAVGDESYTQQSVYRAERHCCLGGNVPSVQFGHCGCGEWCCCADICCGLCDICNPCCRKPLFDMQRAQQKDAGYSKLLAWAIVLLLAVGLIVVFVGYESGMAGRIMVENGINQIVPAIVNTIDAFLSQIVAIAAGLMNMSDRLDKAISVGTKSNAAPASFAGGTAVATQAMVDGAVLAVHALKALLCGLDSIRIPSGGVLPETGLFGLIGWALGLIIYYGLVLPIPFVLVGALGSLQMCVPFFTAFRRFPLAFSAVVAGMCCYAAVMYSLFFPLSMVVSDLCGLMESINQTGTMKGFPNEKPPAMCGPGGALGALPDATEEIVTQSYETMCDSYNSTCGMGVLYAIEFGGHGLKATTCPNTISCPTGETCSPAAVPITDVLSPESCKAPPNAAAPAGVGGGLTFNKHTTQLKNNVKFNNIRYGTSASSADEVIGYSAPSAVKTSSDGATTCKYSWYDSVAMLQGTDLADSTVKFSTQTPVKTPPNFLAKYPRFVLSDQLRKASCSTPGADLNTCDEYQEDNAAYNSANFIAPAFVPLACGVGANNLPVACTNPADVTNTAAQSERLFKCHGSKDAPAWLNQAQDGDDDLAQRMGSTAFPITDAKLPILVEPTDDWTTVTGAMPSSGGIDVYFSCYPFTSATSGATCLDGNTPNKQNDDGNSPCKDQKTTSQGACATFDATAAVTGGPPADNTASTECMELAKDLFGDDGGTAAGTSIGVTTTTKVSTDPNRYTLVNGVCKYSSTKAQIKLFEVPFACAMDDRNTPVVCEDEAVSVADCDAALSSSDDCSTKCCDDPRTQRFASAIVRTEELAEMAEEMRYLGYEAKDDGKTCADLSPTYPVQCLAGTVMRSVVDCSLIDIMAVELSEPVCASLGGGFTALTAAYTTFVFAYALCAFAMLLGYKRWQSKYQTGASTSMAGLSSMAGNLKSSMTDARKVDFKELTKTPQQYTLDPAYDNQLVWGNKGPDANNAGQDEAPSFKMKGILESQLKRVSGRALQTRAEGVTLESDDDSERKQEDVEMLKQAEN